MADIVIIIGTSLLVFPFASLVDLIPETSKIMYINRKIFDLELLDMFALENNVFLQGDCDDWCLKIAEKLHWEEDLLNLIKKNKGKDVSMITESMKKLTINEIRKKEAEESKIEKIICHDINKDQNIQSPIPLIESIEKKKDDVININKEKEIPKKENPIEIEKSPTVSEKEIKEEPKAIAK